LRSGSGSSQLAILAVERHFAPPVLLHFWYGRHLAVCYQILLPSSPGKEPESRFVTVVPKMQRRQALAVTVLWPICNHSRSPNSGCFNKRHTEVPAVAPNGGSVCRSYGADDTTRDEASARIHGTARRDARCIGGGYSSVGGVLLGRRMRSSSSSRCTSMSLVVMRSR
jgi:hypothetical protein